MDYILFDTSVRAKLFPLTLTKAVADLRMGILTIKERWDKMLGVSSFVLTDHYLQSLYPLPPAGEYIFIDACVIPDKSIIEAINSLKTGEAIEDENGFIAARIVADVIPDPGSITSLAATVSRKPLVQRLSFPFELFQWNAKMIGFDFNLITKGRISNDTKDTVHIYKPSQIFVEDGAEIDYSFLNASNGPIYIGRNATIMEGCVIRGPFALCEGAVLKMGAKIYGATTVGPYSSAGGEIKNSIISGFSNKAHDGYLGDSVIGEWCNLGAGTSNSNLKNTATTVKLWNYDENNFIPVDIKCGVIMGDYSRTAINSSINTGSVIGVCCNVFGEGLLPKHIPDFTWGSTPDKRYLFDKCMRDITNWKKLKDKSVSEQETQVLKHIFDLSEQSD